MIIIFSYFLFLIFFFFFSFSFSIRTEWDRRRENNEFQLSVVDRLILRILTHTKRQPITVKGLVIVQKEKKKESPI